MASASNELGLGVLSSLHKPVDASLNLGDEPVGTFVSPLSIYMALVLLLKGAVPESNVYRELQDLLAGGEKDDSDALAAAAGVLMSRLMDANTQGLELSIANSVWIKPPNTFRPAYLEAVQGDLAASAHQLTSAADVNSWCSKETRGKITEIVDEGTVAAAVAILANAVYFKGKWEHPFKDEDTAPLRFALGNGNDVQAAMMYQKFDRFHAGYVQTASYTGARLPYAGNHFAAVALLPIEGSSPAAVLAELRGGGLAGVRWEKPEMHVWLPRFKIEASAQLKEVLQQLGVTAAFRPSGDLANLADATQPLYVDEVVHKVFIEVNEEGTEAAAVTATMVRMTAMPMHSPVELRFDRPFVFALQHVSSGALLFAGVVEQPQVWGECTTAAAGGPPPGYPTA